MTSRQNMIRDLEASLSPDADWFAAQLFREIHQETEKYADMEHDIAQDEREMQFDEEDL